MSAKPCKCSDAAGHARAVESAIYFALFNALRNPNREDFWRSQADKLEQKFTAQHGVHYSLLSMREVA